MPEYICSICGNSFNVEPDRQGNITCPDCLSVFSAATAKRPLPSGTRINGYEIISHIAAGGSGSVYQAEQIAMKRIVALKILNQDQVDRHSAERFLEEARNTAKFENPHVVSVIDTGISPEGYYYIAMQYVKGETLEEMLQRGQVFPEDETLMIGITVADALRSIWQKYKMFHKDIKPGNIMLTPEKEAMILDMGTAQGHGESKLDDGNIEGSPYYMSPEQARGEPLSWNTDQYSLGATMYQMLTGKYPYDGKTVEEILQQHDSAPFPDPAVRAPERPISPQMTALLRRMMGKTPEERYPSWDNFIQDAKPLLASIWAKKGSAVSGSLRKRYMAFDQTAAKPVPKQKNPASVMRFVCFGLLIFILAAAMLGGILLYLAAEKNSANARSLLGAIRQQTDNLQMNPDAMEEAIHKAEPFFNRIGVLPSVRAEFEKCRQKVNDFRKIHRNEEFLINSLESQTAACLQNADQEERNALRAAAEKKSDQTVMNHFQQSTAMLREMSLRLHQSSFILPPNIHRAEQLKKRLNTAQTAVLHKIRIFEQSRAMSKKPRPPQKNPPESGKPSPGPRPVSRPAGLSPRPDAAGLHRPPTARPDSRSQYQQYLEQEKNRIRIQLLLLNPAGKTSPGNPLPQADLGKRKNFPELNWQFDHWFSEIRKRKAAARTFWHAIYNSHQAHAGFHFTVMAPRGETRMELKTILRDTVVLYYRGMPNIQMKFEQLPPAEWLDFLKFAAERRKLQSELDSYYLLNGWFFKVDKSRDPFIRNEMPAMREVFYRFLCGEDFPGVDSGKRPGRAEVLRKYRFDPVFASFRARLKKTSMNSKQPTAIKNN